MQLRSEISLRSKRQAAEELALWFKTYPGPDDQSSEKGFDELVVCAANCLIAHSGEEVLDEDDLVAFIEGIRMLQIQAAALQLMKQGSLSITVHEGELAFATLTESDS